MIRWKRARSSEAGFTLIELMTVVAIIAILAVVVVPQFMSEAKKVTGDSEVNAMFAELGTKLEQYKLEQGTSSPRRNVRLRPTAKATAFRRRA